MNKLVNTTSSLTYEGKVKIKSLKDGKIKVIGNYKNSGGTPLFTFLSRCLIQEYDSALVPRYICAYGDDADTPLLNAYPLSSMKTIDDKTIQYSFTIPTNNFVNETNQVKEYRLICEQNKNTRTPSASIEVDQKVSKASQEAIIIEWQLSIDNV